MALLFFAYGLTRVAGHGAHAGPGLAWVLAMGGKVAGAVCLAALLLLVSMRHLADPVSRRLLTGLRFLPEKQYARAEHLITTFVQGVESTRSDGALVLLLLYSVLEWALIGAVYWCLAQSCSGLIHMSLPERHSLRGVCVVRGHHTDPRRGWRIAGGGGAGAHRAVRSAPGNGHFFCAAYLDYYVCSYSSGRVYGRPERRSELAWPAPDQPWRIEVKCPFCNHLHDKVVDSRESKEGDAIRRRRECLACERRFTTYERIDEVPYMVVKKDGRREKFDRQKVLGGLLKACEKRPVGMAKLSDLVNRVESKVSDSPDREISTTEIGEFLMESLRELDKIAYVRFASVYRDFQDEEAFFNELKLLMRQKLP